MSFFFVPESTPGSVYFYSSLFALCFVCGRLISETKHAYLSSPPMETLGTNLQRTGQTPQYALGFLSIAVLFLFW